MPTEKEKTEIRKLAKNGHSVNQIKEELGLGKSTVYYHFKKEVGQKQKEKALKTPTDQEAIGEICGAFAGDGNYYRDKNYKYRIRFTLNIKEDYWKNLAEFLEENLDKKPRINHQEKYGRTDLRYESKPLLEFLKKHLTWEKEDKTGTIKLKDKKYSKKFKIGFLRGLLDTDGYKDTTRRRYCFSTVSPELAKDISRILGDLDVPCKSKKYMDKRDNCQNMNRVYINGEHTQKLSDKIQPRHPKKRGYPLNK